MFLPTAYPTTDFFQQCNLRTHSVHFRTPDNAKLTCQWTICLSVLGILIVAGVVAGAIEGKKRMDG